MSFTQAHTRSIFELDYEPVPAPAIAGYATNTWINVCELGIKATTHTVVIHCVNRLGGSVMVFTLKGAWLKTWLHDLVRVQLDCTADAALLLRHDHGYALIKHTTRLAPTIRPKMPARKDRWCADYDRRSAEALRTFDQRKAAGTVTINILV